jgi:hypothetical protein
MNERNEGAPRWRCERMHGCADQCAFGTWRFVHTIEAGKTTLRLDKLLDVLTVLGLRLEVERGTRPGPLVAGSAIAGQYGLDTEPTS